MAITISGENNNDRILAQDGVIDQISGINIVGLITASHINVGSNIQLGNAGIITATTFVGNVTGNVNSTSPLLLQTGGSERFRITSDNALGIAGANYGSSGQVLTSGGSGSAVSWATPAVTGFTNGSNNRVVTATSGSGLNGEANLTYDGLDLVVNGTGDKAIRWATGGTNKWSIYHNNGAGALVAYDNANSAERLRINSTGQLLHGHNASIGYGRNFETSSTSGYGGIAINRFSADTGSGGLDFVKSRNASLGGNTILQSDDNIGAITWRGADGTDFTTPAAQIKVAVDGTPGSNDMPGRIMFYTTADGASSVSERLRIDSSGNVNIGVNGSSNPFTYLRFGASLYGAADIRPTDEAAHKVGLAFYTDGTQDTTINPTEKLRIDSSGRIQIGSSTLPARNNFDGIGRLNVTNNSADGTVDYTQGMVFSSNASNEGTWTQAAIVTTGSSGYNGNLIFATDGSGARDNAASNLTERLRLDSSGFIGINDTTPYNGLTINKEGDYWDTNGNTYAHPVGRVLSSWRGDRNDNTDYWVGFVGKYMKPSATVNILLQPHVGNFGNQAGMYIAGEATGNYSSDFTLGKIVSGSQAGRGTSGNQRATKSELFRITNSGNVKFNSGFGSVTVVYGCRAWIQLNQTGTQSINGSGGVSSIADLGTGHTQVNFATAMPDDNYAMVGGAQQSSNGGVNYGFSLCMQTRNTGNANFIYRPSASSDTKQDNSLVDVAFFR